MDTGISDWKIARLTNKDCASIIGGVAPPGKPVIPPDLLNPPTGGGGTPVGAGAPPGGSGNPNLPQPPQFELLHMPKLELELLPIPTEIK
jgi:hypothetical protein